MWIAQDFSLSMLHKLSLISSKLPNLQEALTTNLTSLKLYQSNVFPVELGKIFVLGEGLTVVVHCVWVLESPYK
ncbi:MAG TPA: hypothetical protein VN456_11300, partial [Desulfosporosinus sp.]|nr:hypothetical protein [Desulfosporosinus sp.]